MTVSPGSTPGLATKMKRGNKMINNEGQNVLFCYRCCKHIKPVLKRTESEYYRDIDFNLIEALLPHCPMCENEVYSINYHTMVMDFQEYLQNTKNQPNTIKRHATSPQITRYLGVDTDEVQ